MKHIKPFWDDEYKNLKYNWFTDKQKLKFHKDRRNTNNLKRNLEFLQNESKKK